MKSFGGFYEKWQFGGVVSTRDRWMDEWLAVYSKK
jgi:hypothetical protein